jgi:phosphoserine phosphatase RsbU/P
MGGNLSEKFEITALYLSSDSTETAKIIVDINRQVKRLYVAEDTQTGLNYYHQLLPDVVFISDSGFEFIKEIRKIDKYIQVILILGPDETGAIIRSLHLGIDGYLVKPVYGSAITAALEKCVHYVRMADELERQKKVIQKLSIAVEQSPSSVMITDRYGVIEYVNPKFRELTGYSESEVLGKKTGMLKSGETPRETYSELWAAVLSGQEWQGEFVNKKKNGDIYWEMASISPVRDEKGEITHFVAVKEDITKKKIAEKALELSEKRLRYRNEIMENDLKNAQLIQKALLPKEIPCIPQLKIDYRYFPLESVGGDYFSFTQLQEGGMGVFLGDVTGHGVSAALFLALVKAFADRACRKFGQHPKKFFAALNTDLIDNMTTNFLTAIYGFFKFHKAKTNRTIFTFSKGGHPPPIIFHAETKKVELLDVKGTLLGALEDMEYEDVVVELTKGDRLYLYTDGVPETMDGENNIFGMKRLCTLLKKANKQSLEKSLDGVIQELEVYRGETPLHDDIVIIGFEVV